MGRVLSSVDLGSNTLHLLVADVSNRTPRRLANETDWVGLGEVVERLGHVPEGTLDRIVGTLLRFKQSARAAGASAMYVFATEAIRSASNQEEVIRRIALQTGLQMDLISGQREAELALVGVGLDSPTNADLVMAEVGGGSAQVASCQAGAILADSSLPLGTGRLTGRYNVRYPIGEAAETEIEAMVAATLMRAAPNETSETMIASGGVARGLWRALHPDGARHIHSRELRYMQWVTARESLDTISRRFNVKLKRAGTLHLGALVFRAILSHARLDSMYVSEYGVREGAILEMSADRLDGSKL